MDGESLYGALSVWKIVVKTFHQTKEEELEQNGFSPVLLNHGETSARNTKSIWHRKLPIARLMKVGGKKAFKPFVYLHSESPSTMVEINLPLRNEIFRQFSQHFPSF
jgi:hypothetical protein